jgi:hypothetical protein
MLTRDIVYFLKVGERKELTSTKREEYLTQLRSLFKEKRLHKGMSEVICAIVTNQPLEKIVVVGELDPQYLRALIAAVKDTERNEIELQLLSKKEITLVYDSIKSINLKTDQPRLIPRRFFYCRCFAY